MIPLKSVGPLILGLALGGCPDNAAPGNDREAQISPPEPHAEISTVDDAIEGVVTDLLNPQTMTEVDIESISAVEVRCLFRFTTVGLPVLAYGSTAVLKLNGKLVPLPGTGEGRYAADGVTVTVRPLEGEATEGEPFEAEFVLRLSQAPDELGYRGFSVCETPAPG